MSDATDPVALPGAWKDLIFSGVDRVAGTSRGARLIAKAVAVLQTSRGAGNHDDEGERTGENRLISALCEVVRPDLAIDAGANNGSWTLEVRARCPEVPVVSVEPGTQASGTLRSRTRGDSSVFVVQAALGADAGRVTLFGTDQSGLQASLRPDLLQRTTYRDPDREMPAESVDMVTPPMLIELAREAGLIPDGLNRYVIKIDTEGYELDIIQALLTNDLGHALAAVQFEFHMHALAQGHTIDDFQKALGSDYSLFRLAPRSLIPLHEMESSEANYFGFSNWVAIRAEFGNAVVSAYRRADATMRRRQEWRN